MKKLILAIIAIGFCAVSNAASYTWSSGGRLFNGTGTSGAENYVTGVDAYLMFESVVAAADLVSSYQTSKATATATVTGNYIAKTAVSTAAQVSSTATYSTTDTQKAYFVVFANDKMYVSNIMSANYNALAPDEVNDINFGAQSTSSKLSFTSGTFADNGAGWYAASTSPVPEPTSGLLMVLGICGLALRRRHA